MNHTVESKSWEWKAGKPFAGISQSSFRLLIETNADGILVVDRSGMVLYANDAALQIFGHPIEDLLRTPIGLPLAGGETTEITIRRSAGQTVDVEMRVVDIVWEGEAAFLASLRDISSRRAEEERRRQAQKMETLGQLTAGITHDFNNLLAVIDSGLTLLERQIAKDPTESKVLQLVGGIRDGANRAAALTQQLLAFARRQPLAPQSVDVNELVHELADILRRAIGNDITLELTFEQQLQHAFVDPAQLQTAILNLAINARDAMNRQGRLTIETSKDFTETGTCLIRISVRDTGCGMAEDVLAQAFEPFFTTKEDGKGTGLGLSQVYGFIKQSGGHIKIDSTLGEGTTIHLFLPQDDHLNGTHPRKAALFASG